MNVCVCVWIHLCVCVYKEGVFSCRLPKPTVSTKGCVPTLLYGGRSELAAPSRKIQACQQQGRCFTAAMASSRLRCTNNTAQLYDCWPRCWGLICCWERPVAIRCEDAATLIFSLAGRRVKWVFEMNRRRFGGWDGRTRCWIRYNKMNLFNALIYLLGVLQLFSIALA